MNHFEIDDTPDALDALIDKLPSAPVMPSNNTGNLIELKAALDKAVNARAQIESELASIPERIRWASESNNFNELTRLTARRQALQIQMFSAKIFELKAGHAYHTTNIAITGTAAATAYEARERINAEILRLQEMSAQLEATHFNEMSKRRDSTSALAHLNQTLKQFTAAESAAAHKKEADLGAN